MLYLDDPVRDTMKFTGESGGSAECTSRDIEEIERPRGGRARLSDPREEDEGDQRGTN